MRPQKTTWEKCPLCQARIQKEKLPNEEELQGYFMKRVAKYVADKGKGVMGWDELTNSSMPARCDYFWLAGHGNGCIEGGKTGTSLCYDPRPYHVPDSLSRAAVVRTADLFWQ